MSPLSILGSRLRTEPASALLILLLLLLLLAFVVALAVLVAQCPGFAPGPRARMALPSPFGGSRVLVSIGAFQATAATWQDKCARGMLRDRASE